MANEHGPIVPPVALIIDEHREMAERIIEVLTDAHYDAVITPNTIEPIDVIREVQPDLIVTTLHLHEHLGGVHLMEALANEPDICDIPAIISSTDLEGLDRQHEHLDRLGGVTLHRPFTVADIHTVEAVIQKRRIPTPKNTGNVIGASGRWNWLTKVWLHQPAIHAK